QTRRRRTSRRDRIGSVKASDCQLRRCQNASGTTERIGRRPDGAYDRIRGAREVILAGEIQVVLHMVVDRPIGRAELERVAALNPGESVFELEALLMREVGDRRRMTESGVGNETTDREPINRNC